MTKDDILQALKDTDKKLEDLKGFNIPIILKVIEEYEQAGVDQLFIDQQKIQLEKVYSRINELESREQRLLKRLGEIDTI